MGASAGLERVLTLGDAAIAVVGAPLAVGGAYLGMLSLLARPGPPPAPAAELDVAFVVPAHDEGLSIQATIRSLRAVDYPIERVRIVVVADNCSDETAALAAASGAEVIERNDPQHRGKGFALSFAFERLLAESVPPSAVVVVDADTVVSPNILRALTSRLRAGAQAMQVTYEVANADATWRTALMSVAFACMHDVRSLGRERLGLSTGLRGNGMCFSADALRRVPHRATSLVEDVEHGIDLAEHGIRVVFVPEAWVKAEMPERAENAASQRRRWEAGRAALRHRRVPGLLRDAVRLRDPVRGDLAADLVIPPLAQFATATAAVSAVAVGVALGRGRVGFAPLPAAVAATGLLTHVAVGWRRSGTGMDGLRALAHVPAYVLWKAGLAGRSGVGAGVGGNSALGAGQPDAEEWVRTRRNAETPAQRDQAAV